MPSPSKAFSTLAAATAGVALSVGVAACGSSKAPGVTLAPAAGLTNAPSASAATTTTSQTTTTPPKPPPALAKKPVVSVPAGPAPKGLVIKDLVKGSGQAAVSGDNITVNYVGVLYKNGKEFDSSWKTGTPITLPLKYPGGVIQGWVQGVSGMHVGGRRELIIPPGLAYGSKQGQYPSAVGPNATLVFVVDLLSIG
jgi:peptidylprolyl isomerase